MPLLLNNWPILCAVFFYVQIQSSYTEKKVREEKNGRYAVVERAQFD